MQSRNANPTFHYIVCSTYTNYVCTYQILNCICTYMQPIIICTRSESSAFSGTDMR